MPRNDCMVCLQRHWFDLVAVSRIRIPCLSDGQLSGAMNSERPAAGILLFLYLVFILYGSFFPFHFSDDAALRDLLAAVVVSPWDFQGHRVFSIPDLISNVLLGMPFGLLLVIRGLAGTSLPGRIARVAIFDLLLAGGIEIGQLFAPGRTTSILDVSGQVAGGMGGAIGGHFLLRCLGGSLARPVLGALRRRPLLVPLALLVGVLAADALHPYAVTLDVSSIWESAKAASWVPFRQASRLPWHAIVVERILPYAVLAGLLSAVLHQGGATFSRVPALALGTAVALGLELGKLFIEGRAPSADHVLAAIIGLAAGRAALPVVRRLRPEVLGGWTVVLAAGLMAYEELTPFDMVWSVGHLRSKVASIEWAPFAAYYWAAPQTALFDTGKKLLLGGLFGAALHAVGHRPVASVTLTVSALLEAVQLIETSHYPSVTDVFLLAAGAAAGRAALNQYRALANA